MIGVLDVLWIWDESLTASGPKWKMMICIEPDFGIYLRINTRSHFRPCVKIRKAENGFLAHDSHVQCELVELEDSYIEEGLAETDGPIGTLNQGDVKPILDELLSSTLISDKDKQRISSCLGLFL